MARARASPVEREDVSSAERMRMELVPPSEHQVLVFLVALLVLVGTARVLGALAQRVNQPAVVGELAAGLLLGPSVLGRLAPGVAQWLFPPDDVQTGMLFTVAWLGVIFLLLGTGFETDLGLIRRLGRVAAIVSTGSLVVPVALGLLTGALMPDVLVGTDDRTSFALFMGAALSISSLPVIAKILTEMGFIRRDFGQLTLAAGMANDVVGWVALGLIAGLVSAGSISAGAVTRSLLGLTGFFVVAFTAGQVLTDRLFRELRRSDATPVTRSAVLVILTLAGAAVTQELGVEAVLGAFVVGILVGRSPYRDARIMHPIETLTGAFLAPVFFATAGLRVDLGLLGDPTVALWSVVVLAVASVSKFGGAWLGSTLARRPSREGLALGVALNARGALEVVIASVGLSLGVLNVASYTAVVLMAMATSMMAPPLLQLVLAGWQGTVEERERLKREEAHATNLVVRSDRVLIPSRGGPHSLLAAQVADLAWPSDAAFTVLAVGNQISEEDLLPMRGVLGDRRVTVEFVKEPVGGLARAIVSESKLGYGAIVVGVGDDGAPEALPPLVHDIVAGADLPVVVVRRPRNLQHRTPWAFARSLVPVAGGRTARAAQEVAFGISSLLGTETVVAHVHERDHGATSGQGRDLFQAGPGRRILGEASRHAHHVGARVQTVERSGPSASKQILALAAEVPPDLIVLGTTLRRVDGHQMIGSTAAEVLDQAVPTVVVVILPEAPQR